MAKGGEGRHHCFDNKVESTVQVICLLLVSGGTYMVYDQVDTDPFFAGVNTRSITFEFVTGVILCAMLLFNSAMWNASMAPALVAVAFYYFPTIIAYADEWRRVGKDSFEDYTSLMSGVVMCLASTSVATVMEVSVPASGSGRRAGVGGPEMFALFLAVVGVAGLGMLWYELDVTFASYNELFRFSLQSVMALVLLADSMMHYDVSISYTAVFIGINTGCNMYAFGIKYDKQPTEDEENAFLGCLIASCCLFFLSVVLIGTISMGRNENHMPRRVSRSKSKSRAKRKSTGGGL